MRTGYENLSGDDVKSNDGFENGQINNFNSKTNSKKRFEYLGYGSQSEHFSLPDSPVNDHFSNEENFVSRQNPVDKKQSNIINQKKKEKLLCAHDQIDYDVSDNVEEEDYGSVAECMERLKNEDTEEEFSSDSLESETFGSSWCPRRCVSDYQIFSKECRNLTLFSEKNSEELSDTDISGLNSLQGSGDILEMQERDVKSFHDHRRVVAIERHGSVDLSKNKWEKKNVEKLNKSVENILFVDDDEKKQKSPPGLLSLSRTGRIGSEPLCKKESVIKKSDAFFVELTNNCRNRSTKGVVKPLRIHNRSSNKNDGTTIGGKPMSLPNPIIRDSKIKKKDGSGKKLLMLKTNQLVLPNKVTQDENSGDEEGLRRAISLSDLSASPNLQMSSSSKGKMADVKMDNNNSNGFNNYRTKSRGQSMVRCSSVGGLNRMDGDLDGQTTVDNKKTGTVKSLMRPTISSQNKMAAPTVSKNQNLSKRRTAAFSSVNLTTVGINDDSSSEETGFGRTKYSDKNK
ncbi:hypothetical protein Phum_PHUM235950 [Pediculus humanus corporis]|uniref:Uncharacterized protein n=1 Tax=Pediculus humanus subsp. corporis TaxID=121224 RepID=E0VIZ1_PEDHC|nr:uncharacterized protein Phum_PHUM235950 [Pediculus humanus corporis]EEB13347.1 hypothetical protein Phum_PHUM235950 [Pediculus humanus corporis]